MCRTESRNLSSHQFALESVLNVNYYKKKTSIPKTSFAVLAACFLAPIGTLPGAITPIIFGVLGDVYRLAASILSLLASIAGLFMTENKVLE